jgi:hypothetical protein
MKETAKEVKEEFNHESTATPKPREVVVQSEESTTFWPLSCAAAPTLERLGRTWFRDHIGDFHAHPA